MKATKPLTWPQANSLLRWHSECSFSVAAGKPKMIALDWNLDKKVIDLIDQWFGLERVEPGSDGLLISELVVAPLLRAAHRRKDREINKNRRKKERKEEKERQESLAALKPAAKAATAQSNSDVNPSYSAERARPLSNLHWVLADEHRIPRKVDECGDLKERRPRKEMLERLRMKNVRRLPLACEEHLEVLDDLLDDFPNFAGAIGVIRDHLSLLLLAETPLSLPPLLLVGPPGVGKTFFVGELGRALNLSIEMRSFAETTAGFVITGSSSTWSGAQAGVVAKLVIDSPHDTLPLLLLDEIDKANKGNFSPENVMLGLLEPNTAKCFRDEYLDVEMDVRPMAVFATANAEPARSSPLASRMTVIKIGLPDAAQMAQVVRSVDRSLRSLMPTIAERFEPLSDDIITKMAVAAPRELRKSLQRAYSVAARQAHTAAGDSMLVLTWSHCQLAMDSSGRGLAESAGAASTHRVRLCDLPLLVASSCRSRRVH